MNKHIDSDARYQIQIGLAQGLSVSAIAQSIGYSVSTVYREIARNNGGAGYLAKFAQQRANARALRSRNAVVIPDNTWHSVDHYLRLEHSPEQIAGLLNISHETIYRYVYRDKKANGCLHLHLHLRCQKPCRKRCSGANRARRGHIPNPRRIDERPAHIEERAQVGHWEFDSIVGPAHASSLITGVERKSGYVVIALLDNPGAEGANRAMVKLLKPMARWVKTVTTDNGGEFAMHERLDEQVSCTSYFCRPYASWERGSNENANGLIRQYLPKKRDLSTVTQQEIDMIMDRLNNRPRKRLGFKTPNQVFLQSLKRFAIRR
jgi:transposase, IS30 family